MRILFVDDQPDILKMLSLMMKKEGFEVMTATSAKEAFGVLHLEDPAVDKACVDLIMMDIQMPNMDGIEACRRIKASERYRDIPVLMLTAMEDARHLQMAFSAGAWDYITKPFKKTELQVRIESFLRLKTEMEHRKSRELELLETTKQLESANHILENLSAMDHLTGLANRRTFDQDVLMEWKRGQREKNPLSILLIDVDFFKPYNDTYGHLAGDQALIQISKTLKSVLKRPGDIVARYGGEEFAAVLPDTDEKGALKIAEEMRSKILSKKILHENSPHKRISVSIGIATTIPIPQSCPEELISQADQALYCAKKKRNIVCVYDPK